MATSNVNWTAEMLCILHGRKHSINSSMDDMQYDFLELIENKFWADNGITLEKLLQMSVSEFKSLPIPQGHGLWKELRNIREECEKKKALCLTDTALPYRYDYTDISSYTHWLPLDPTRLLGVSRAEIENNWENVLETKYEEFDTLVHATHIDTTSMIFEDQLRTNKVRDNSVFSKIPGHPNAATKVIWFGPARREEINPSFESEYGNVVFYMKKLHGTEGIRRIPSVWNYYFVEVIDYATQSACRILVTPHTYPHLRPYDPTKKGGPWYYDESNRKDYWLKDIVRWNGTRGKNGNSLEIMREDYGKWQGTFLRNLHICPVLHPRCKKGCESLGSKMDEFVELITFYKPIYPLNRYLLKAQHLNLQNYY